MLTLVGLITKHGILMVEFANELQLNEGLDRRSAIEMAARVRLRPILMTTAAMVTGLMPLLTATGRRRGEPLLDRSVVVVAGMSIGTLFTLFVLPAVYVGDGHRPPGQGRAPSGPRRSRISISADRRSSRPEHSAVEVSRSGGSGHRCRRFFVPASHGWSGDAAGLSMLGSKKKQGANMTSDFPAGNYRFIPACFSIPAARRPTLAMRSSGAVRQMGAAGRGLCADRKIHSGGGQAADIVLRLRAALAGRIHRRRLLAISTCTTSRRWRSGVSIDGKTNPVARSNVCPEIDPPAEPSFYAFSFTRPSQSDDAELSSSQAAASRSEGNASYAERTVRYRDTQP